jgi:hypothetical protein
MKYTFWIEVDNDAESSPSPTSVVEWRNLTKHTAVMMYNATARNCRTNEVKRYGWGVQE